MSKQKTAVSEIIELLELEYQLEKGKEHPSLHALKSIFNCITIAQGKLELEKQQIIGDYHKGETDAIKVYMEEIKSRGYDVPDMDYNDTTDAETYYNQTYEQ